MMNILLSPRSNLQRKNRERGQDAVFLQLFGFCFHTRSARSYYEFLSQILRCRYEKRPDSISTQQCGSRHTGKLNKPSGGKRQRRKATKEESADFLTAARKLPVSPAFVSGEPTYLIKNLAKYPFTRCEEVLMGPVRHGNTK